MIRLTKDEYVCLLALAASARSEDPHTTVGAALLDIYGNVLGTGTNGLSPGMKVPDWMYKQENRAQKANLMIHAEMSLWLRKKDGIEHTIGLTISPCSSCSKLIAASKIKNVLYLKNYERGDGEFRRIFDFYGISCRMLDIEEKSRIKAVLGGFLENSF